MANDRPILGASPLEVVAGIEGVVNGLGNWIAGPVSNNPVAAAIQARYRDSCDSWSNGLEWTVGLNPANQAAFSALCKPWLDSQGSGDPVLVSEFTGGQCECPVSYDVTVGFFNSGVKVAEFVQQSLFGPISGAQNFRDEGGFRRADVNSTLRQNGICGGTRTSTFQTSEIADSARVISVRRRDGQPDDCGDPPGQPGPNPNPRPNPNLPPTETPFEDPGGRVVVPMPPITTPFGDPVQLPNFKLPPLFNSGDPVQPPQTGPGSPGTPVETGEGGDAEGEAPEGRVLIGVRVNVLAFPGNARRPQNIPGDWYIGAAYVGLGWPDQLDYQPEAQFLNDGQFFVAPEGSQNWQVSATLGYNLRVTPYYISEPISDV